MRFSGGWDTVNNWFDDDAPGVDRIFFARNIVQTWAAWSAGISGSHGKLGVVATVRTAELGLPLGSELAIIPSGRASLLS